MAYIPFPAGVGLRSVQWRAPFDTAQANRSAFTGTRQVVELPGGGRWTASGEFVPMIGQDASLNLRAFLAALRGPVHSFALPAFEARQASILPLTSAAQALTAGAGMSVSGRTLTKTGVTNAFDAQVTSAALTGGCVLHFRAGQVNRAFAIGIDPSPALNANETNMDHAFSLTAGGKVQIIENGGFVAEIGNYTPTDLFSIIYTGAAVGYYVNGGLVRSVAKSAGLSLAFDSSFQSSGAVANDVAFTGRALFSAGARAVSLRGFPASSVGVIRAGWFATALFEDGTAQLLTITADANSDASGVCVANFDAPLRKLAYAIIVDFPFAHMSLADVAQWSVDPAQIYQAGFTAEESW